MPRALGDKKEYFSKMDVKSQNYIKIRNSYLNAKCTMVRMRYQKAFQNNNHDFELSKQTKKKFSTKKTFTFRK